MKKKKDNVKFIHDFMSYGSPMNQLFLMDAIGKQARLVIENADELRISMKDSFVHPEAWIRAATEFQEQYKENYD